MPSRKKNFSTDPGFVVLRHGGKDLRTGMFSVCDFTGSETVCFRRRLSGGYKAMDHDNCDGVVWVDLSGCQYRVLIGLPDVDTRAFGPCLLHVGFDWI